MTSRFYVPSTALLCMVQVSCYSVPGLLAKIHLSCPAQVGTHYIRISARPPYFTLGSAITLSIYVYVCPLQVENKCASLLKHPLVTSLLSCKWRSYGRYLFFGNLFLYFLFLVFLTAFTLTVLTPLSDTCEFTRISSLYHCT